MQQQEATGTGGKPASLQAICGDQRQAIESLLANFQGHSVREDVAFLDLGCSGMSSEGAEETLERTLDERFVRGLEDVVLQTQSMSALGQAISSLVHEVSQPLTALRTYATGCRHLVRLGRYEELDGALQQILDQSDRTFQIVRSIRGLLGAVDLPVHPASRDLPAE